MSFYQYLLVGFGGALGATSRMLITRTLPLLFAPYGILMINISGGFMIGMATSIFLGLDSKTANDIKLFGLAGFLGGFTTFSAFTAEIAYLLEKEKYLHALVYILLSVLLSIIFFYIGIKLGKCFKKY